jgi:hypothetical protein
MLYATRFTQLENPAIWTGMKKSKSSLARAGLMPRPSFLTGFTHYARIWLNTSNIVRRFAFGIKRRALKEDKCQSDD